MTAPIKTCDFCNATGVMPTFMDGTTVCYGCLPTLPKTLREAWREIVLLRTKIEQMESRIELLEHDLKSGDYETLYAQTVVELAQLRKDADKFDDGIDWIQRALQAEAEVEVLRAKIEVIEKQEPIAWTTELALRHGASALGFDACVTNLWSEKGVPLYALPGVQGEEK